MVAGVGHRATPTPRSRPGPRRRGCDTRRDAPG
jgi:hypothetical protein